MKSNTARIAALAAAASITVGGLTACGSDDETGAGSPYGTGPATTSATDPATEAAAEGATEVVTGDATEAAQTGSAPLSATERSENAPDDAITDKPGGSTGDVGAQESPAAPTGP